MLPQCMLYYLQCTNVLNESPSPPHKKPLFSSEADLKKFSLQENTTLPRAATVGSPDHGVDDPEPCSITWWACLKNTNSFFLFCSWWWSLSLSLSLSFSLLLILHKDSVHEIAEPFRVELGVHSRDGCGVRLQRLVGMFKFFANIIVLEDVNDTEIKNDLKNL